MILAKMKRTIEENGLLSPGDHVLVAVSGGADSMALLTLLQRLAPGLSLTLAVAHVEHGLRGEESLADAAFVRDYAQRVGLPVYVGHFHVRERAQEEGISEEMAAREVRYQYLKKVAAQIGAGKIALAHQANDQVETILWRLLRGTSPAGLAGIPRMRSENGVTFIRPLLSIWREEIEKYCEEEGIPFRTDSTNTSWQYVRNKIRWHLLPLLKQEYNQNVYKTIYQLGEILREENLYMEAEAKKALEKVSIQRGQDHWSLDLAKMQKLPVALQRRVIKLILYYLSEHTREWESTHVEGIRHLMRSDVPSARLDLGSHFQAFREYNLLHISCRAAPCAGHIPPTPLAIPGCTQLPEFHIQVDAEVREGAHTEVHSPWEARFDYDEVAGYPLYVRSRREGDVLQPLGMSGTKKVKDIFIDAKVPRKVRDRWPLLIWNERVEWIIGIRRGRGALVRPSTRRTLCIRVTKTGG